MFKRLLRRKLKDTKEKMKSYQRISLHTEDNKADESDCDTLIVHPSLSLIEDLSDLENAGQFINQNNSNKSGIIYKPNICTYPNCCTNHMMKSIYKTNSEHQPSQREMRRRRLDLYFKKYPPIIPESFVNTKPIQHSKILMIDYDFEIPNFKPIPLIITYKAAITITKTITLNHGLITQQNIDNNCELIHQSLLSIISSTKSSILSISMNAECEISEFNNSNTQNSNKSISTSYLTCKEAFSESICHELDCLSIDKSAYLNKSSSFSEFSDISINWFTSDHFTSDELDTIFENNVDQEDYCYYANDLSIISSIPSEIQNFNNNNDLTFISSYISLQRNQCNNEDLTNISYLTSNSLKEKYQKNFIFEKIADKINIETSFKLSTDQSSYSKTDSFKSKTSSKLPRRINKRNSNSNLNSCSMIITDTNTNISNFDDSELSISLNL